VETTCQHEGQKLPRQRWSVKKRVSRTGAAVIYGNIGQRAVYAEGEPVAVR